MVTELSEGTTFMMGTTTLHQKTSFFIPSECAQAWFSVYKLVWVVQSNDNYCIRQGVYAFLGGGGYF